MVERTLKHLDVPLGNGAVLRVGLFTGAKSDEGGDLLLAAGFPDRLSWPRIMAEGVNVPAASLPALREALDELQGAGHG